MGDLSERRVIDAVVYFVPVIKYVIKIIQYSWSLLHFTGIDTVDPVLH